MNTITNAWWRKVVQMIVLVAMLAPTLHVTAPLRAQADDNKVFMYQVEDPRIRMLIGELKALLPKLFKMLFSFKWLTEPREFYRTVKSLFKVWYRLMTELAAVLMEYIRELEGEIQNSQCVDQACSNFD